MPSGESDPGYEVSKSGGRKRPDLRLDAATHAGFYAQEAGPPRRPTWQRVQPIIRRGRDGAQVPSTAVRQLVVQRQTRHMRADNRDFDLTGSCTGQTWSGPWHGVDAGTDARTGGCVQART